MQTFRRLIGSKYGGIFALGFIGLIAFAFAAGDINNHGGLGIFGPSSGEVARVGKESLTVAELQARVQRVFERAREDRPELTMAQFLNEGGLRQVTDELIASKALIAYGKKNGLAISKALVDAEIARIPAFADAAGNFSEERFRALLAQQRVSEQELRADISAQLIRQQLVAAAGAGARTPDGMVRPYAAMLLEDRTGKLYAVPSARFAPKAAPSEDQLKAFYAGHRDLFTLPEQRRLRYMVVDRSRFEGAATPSDAEIAAAYKAKAASFAARSSRDFEQLIVPTEAAAKDIAAKVKAGGTLADAARGVGLAASRLADLDQGKLTAQTNDAIAKAAFAAPQGGLAGPLKSPLGWTLLRVEAVKSIPGKTLDQAKPEIVAELRKVKALEAFSSFMNEVDGQIGDGATFAEIAKARGLTVAETALVTGEGRDVRNQAFQADDTLKALLKPGFAMSADDDPQIVSIKPDESAAILAVADVVAPGPPPLAEARAAALVAYGLAQGEAKARAAAEKLAAALRAGTAPEKALADAGLTGVPTQPLGARRGDLTQGGQKIPPPLLALFSMKKGSAQVMPLDNDRGFVVVRLDEIRQTDPSDNPQLLEATRAGLINVIGKDYADQMVIAAEQDVGVTRNQAALAAVEAALRKANGSAD